MATGKKYSIKLDIGGIEEVIDKVEAVADRIAHTRKEVTELEKEARKAGTRDYEGPYQKRQRLLDMDTSGMTSAQRRDHELRLSNLQRQIERDYAKNIFPEDKGDDDKKNNGIRDLLQALQGGGGARNAIIEQLSNNPGLAAAAARLALPVAVAVGGVLGLRKLMDGGAERMRAGADAYWIGGGNNVTAGILAGLSKFFGTTPGELAGRAVGFGDRLRRGGYGSAFMRAQGIFDVGIYTTDKSENYIKAMDALRRVKRDSDAIRIARDLGMEQELSVRDLSDSTYRQLKDTYRLAGMPSERRNVAEYEATKAIFSTELDSLWRTVSSPFMKLFGSSMRWNREAGEGLQDLAQTDPLYPVKAAFSGRYWKDLFTGNLADIDRFRKGLPEEGAGPKADKKTIDSNTDALHQVNRTLKDFTEVIGGAYRARNAIPSGWRFQQMEDALNGQAQMLGAFHI